MTKFFKYAFLVAVAVLLVWSLSNLASAQTTISGSQIRAGAIQNRHLGDSLDWIIAIRLNDSTVKYAQIANGVANGVLTSAMFKTTTWDSLQTQLIKKADSATYALSILNGTVDDTLKFSATLRDLLFGRGANPIIYKSLLSLRSDTAGYAASAGSALIADSAKKTPSTSRALIADSAVVAAMAHYAMYYDTVTSAGSVVWASFSAAVLDSFNRGAIDTAKVARAAIALNTNGITAITDIDATTRAAYIPTADEKLAIKGTTTLGAASSATNRLVDSSSFANKAILKNDEIKSLRVHFDLIGNIDEGKDSTYTVSIDTSAGQAVIRFFDGSDNYSAFLDSTLLQTVMGQGFVRKFGGWTTATISGSTPSGGVEGDVWIDSTSKIIYLNVNDVWEIVGGGGSGADSATTVVLHNRGGAPLYLDADLLAALSLADTFLQDVTLSGNADLLAGDATTDLGESGNKLRGGYFKRIYPDTIGNAASDSILIYGDMFFRGAYSTIGRAEGGAGVNPRIYATLIQMDTTLGVGSPIQAKNGGSFGCLYPYPTSHVGDSYGYGAYLGQRGTSNVSFGLSAWDMVNTRKISIQDCLYVADTTSGYSTNADNYTLIMPRYGILVKNDDIFVNGGTISLTGSGKIVTEATGSVAVGSVKMYNTYIEIPNDSGFKTPTTRGYLATKNENDAMDSSCNPGGTNPYVTKIDLKDNLPFILPLQKSESLAVNYKQMYNWIKRRAELLTGCRGQMGGSYIIPVGDTTKQACGFPWPDFNVSPYIVFWDSAAWNAPHFITPPTVRNNTFYVRQNALSQLSRFTNEFKTAQEALDSIPNVRIKIKTAAQNSSTITFSPNNALHTYKAVPRYGSLNLDSMTCIPYEFRQGGEWFVCGTVPTATKAVWTQIISWVNDSTATIADTQIVRDAAISDCLVTISKATSLRFRPTVDGNYWLVDSIHVTDYAPLDIAGEGEHNTTLTNGMKKEKGSNLMFYNLPTDMCQGQSITIRDMTIGTNIGSHQDTSCMILSGKVTLQNLSFATITDPAADVDNDAFITYRSMGTGDKTALNKINNTLLAENVTVKMDTQMFVYFLAGDYHLSFQSQNSCYGISGDNGRFLMSGATFVSDNPLRFFNDQFYVTGRSTANAHFETTEAQSDSLCLEHCILTDDQNTSISSGNIELSLLNDAIFTANAKMIPVKLRRIGVQTTGAKW